MDGGEAEDLSCEPREEAQAQPPVLAEMGNRCQRQEREGSRSLSDHMPGTLPRL